MAKERVISELFYPDGIKCIVCDAELPSETRYCVCDSCKLPFNVDYCKICGRGKKSHAAYCDDCKHGKWEFSVARSSFEFAGEVKNLIYRFKYGNERYLSDYLGEFMADTYFESELSVDAITYVPLHKKRLRLRGYNQSELLARRIGELISLPTFGLLDKVSATKNLAKLNKKMRQDVISGSFGLNSGELARFLTTMRGINDDFRFEDAKILLIDDIFTTGATSNECAKMLKGVGIGEVFVLCCASVPMLPELIK